MAMRTVPLELPEELINLLGTPQTAAAEARRALVLELLRDARISQGRAAELLGLTRAQILSLMAERHILSGPETTKEFDEELASLRRYVRQRGVDGGDQR